MHSAWSRVPLRALSHGVLVGVNPRDGASGGTACWEWQGCDAACLCPTCMPKTTPAQTRSTPPSLVQPRDNASPARPPRPRNSPPTPSTTPTTSPSACSTQTTFMPRSPSTSRPAAPSRHPALSAPHHRPSSQTGPSSITPISVQATRHRSSPMTAHSNSTAPMQRKPRIPISSSSLPCS